MFFGLDKSKLNAPAETKSLPVNRSVDKIAGKDSNPVWQSLAFNPVTIQTKLDISRPGDGYEQEADRVADQVMRMPDPGAAAESGRAAEGAPDTSSSRQTLPRGSSRALPEPTRTFFEPRFGRDLSAVRVHTGAHASEMARAVNAKAFTIGRDIVFGAGQFAPADPKGKRLLGHELAHVVQQSPADRQRPAKGGVAPPVQQTRSGGPALQRQPAGPEGLEQTTTGSSMNLVGGVADLKLADAAVRDFFGSLIKGAGVQPSQFKVVEEEKFGKAIPNAKEAVPKLLLKMFLNPDSNIAHNILRFHGVGAFLGPDPVKRLTSFIDERIKAGFFAYNDATSEVHLTPEQLVAWETKGVTTGSEQRAQRQIVVQQGSAMSTVVHEVMHFYTHPTYLAEVAQRAEVAKKAVVAGKPGTTHFGGVLLSEALIEGVTEYFARQVMRAREKQLGEMGSGAYSTYVEAIEKLAEVSGEQTLRLAYLQGDKQAIARLYKNVEIFNRLLDEGNFSADKIVEIHHLHEPLGASWFQ
jgi:hypothetical protein